jgi:transposase
MLGIRILLPREDGMGNFTYVGIDVGKLQLSCALPGRKPFDLPNDRDGIQLLLDQASALAPPEQLCFVMESTGEYSSFTAFTLLELAPTQVSIVPPACIIGFKKAGLTRTKNDRVDAEAIREFGEKKQPALWLPPTAAQRRLRSLQLVMDSLRRAVTQQKCVREKLMSAHEFDSYAVDCIERVICSLEQEHARVQAEFDAVIAAEETLMRDSANILSIPGVGVMLRNVLLAVCYRQLLELPQRKLLAHCGLSPREHSSGQHKGRTLMSKTGDARIRRVLYMAAMTAIRKGGLFHEYFQRHIQRGKNGKVALVCVMRRLLYIIQGVVKSNSAFDIERFAQTS